MFLSTYLPRYVSFYLSTQVCFFLPIYLGMFLYTYLSTEVCFFIPNCLRRYVSFHLHIYLGMFLSTYLCTYVCFFPPTYRPRRYLSYFNVFPFSFKFAETISSNELYNVFSLKFIFNKTQGKQAARVSNQVDIALRLLGSFRLVFLGYFALSLWGIFVLSLRGLFILSSLNN